MTKNKYEILILIISFLISCDSNNVEYSNDKNIERCPCDSIQTFKIKNKEITYSYLGNSNIAITKIPNSDTVEVTRYYTTDTVWHIQEYLLIANNEIVDSMFAIYCDIKDTANFYKISYNMNDELERNPNVKFISNIGTEAIIHKDTIRSTTTTIVIPKEKFKGIIKIVRRSNVIYKGKTEIIAPFMFIDALSLVKYGNLLEQYKTINKLCNKNTSSSKGL